MMDTDNKIINVLWADDDKVIGGLFPEDYNVLLKKEFGINVLAQAYNSSELEELLERFEHQVDAVITDANMRKSSSDSVSERDFSGLADVVLHIIRSLEEKGKAVRFYLYTGRKEMLSDQTSISEEVEKYFTKLNRYFVKNNYKELFKKIREDFENDPPKQFSIKEKYKEELEIAELVRPQFGYKLLMDQFLREQNNDSTVPIDDFNEARKVLEGINAGCQKHKLVPKHLTLNQFKDYFKNGIVGEAELLEPIMPSQLVAEMELFLNLTNDGSHHDEQINRDLESYIIKSMKADERIYIYNIIHYILLDLLLWYKRTVKKYKDHPEPLWTGSIYEDEAVVTRIEQNLIFFESLESNETYFTYTRFVKKLKISLSYDDVIGIIKRRTNTKLYIDARQFILEDGFVKLEENGE